MASTVKIESALDSSASSALNIGANTQKLRATAGKDQNWLFAAENFNAIQSAVARLERRLRLAPHVSHIEIDSADILSLIVGGRTGPGQLTILSGPPSYTRIGFDGTEDTDIEFTIASVSGATVNTTAPHSFQPGDQILIEGNSSINHLGYWEVDTTPGPTSLTLVDPPSGSGSTGTVTFLYAGGWRKTFAIGGDGFDSAPFFGNVNGEMHIGKNGSISLLDMNSVAKGFLGVETDADQVVSAIADNGDGLIRLTVTAHGWTTGDDVFVSDLGGDADGDWSITVVDANTVDLRGSTYSGGYSAPGTAYRYRGPLWGQSIAGGGTGFDDATFRVFRNGLRLGEANGPRLEFDGETGEMSMTDATLRLEQNGVISKIDNTDVNGQVAGFVTYNDDLTFPTQLRPGELAIDDLIDPASIRRVRIQASGSNTQAEFIFPDGVNDTKFSLNIDNTNPNMRFMRSGVLGMRFEYLGANPTFEAYQYATLAGAVWLDNLLNAALNSLELTTPLDIPYGGTGATTTSAALGNLGGTTMAAVQAWVNSQGFLTQSDADLLYSALGHNHSGVYSVIGHDHSASTNSVNTTTTNPHTHTVTVNGSVS